MIDEKWQNITGRIKDDFELIEEGKEDLEEVPGHIEFIIFQGPLGRMKLQRTIRPVVLDKKTTGSRRIGGETSVEYVYSDTEFSKKFQAFKWDEGQNDWQEMEAKSFEE